jgi:multidrug transporter EmrE-like cation transporter
VKWRIIGDSIQSTSVVGQILKFLSDPVILSAYAAALLASFAWLFIVTKFPLTVAFPIYIGATFVLVFLGSWFFLSEALTTTRILAILLIFSGIVLGLKS